MTAPPDTRTEARPDVSGVPAPDAPDNDSLPKTKLSWLQRRAAKKEAERTDEREQDTETQRALDERDRAAQAERQRQDTRAAQDKHDRKVEKQQDKQTRKKKREDARDKAVQDAKRVGAILAQSGRARSNTGLAVLAVGLLIALAANLILSSYGLYSSGVDLGHMPGYLAVCLIGAADGLAIAGLGATVVARGLGFWAKVEAWVVFLAFDALSAYIQYTHADRQKDLAEEWKWIVIFFPLGVAAGAHLLVTLMNAVEKRLATAQLILEQAEAEAEAHREELAARRHLAEVKAQAEADALRAEGEAKAEAARAEARAAEAEANSKLSAAHAEAQARVRQAEIEAEVARERMAAEAEARRVQLEMQAAREAREAEAARLAAAERAEQQRLAAAAAEAERVRAAEAEAQRLRLAAETEQARLAAELEQARLAARQDTVRERVSRPAAARVSRPTTTASVSRQSGRQDTADVLTDVPEDVLAWLRDMSRTQGPIDVSTEQAFAAGTHFAPGKDTWIGVGAGLVLAAGMDVPPAVRHVGQGEEQVGATGMEGRKKHVSRAAKAYREARQNSVG